MAKPFLSIVIPAYNEEQNIRLGAIDKVVRYLEKQTYTWEVLFVNDGSSDQTKNLIEEAIKPYAAYRCINNPHQGKAATVMTGVKEAKGEIILFTDLDQATPIREIEHVLPWFERGFDIVIGSRKQHREGAPFTRRVMARGFMMIRTIVLGLKGISDTQCGFKAFKQDVAKKVFARLKLYGSSKEVSGSMVTAGFDIEVLFLAKQMGYSIKEVPVEWHYVETRRVNPIKDSWQGLEDILKIRMNAWNKRYEQ